MDLLWFINLHPGKRDPAKLQPYDVDRPLRHFEIRLDMADWKYGWPHKFYVEGIPSPLRGLSVCRSKTYQNGALVARDFRPEPPDAISFAKFYTTHLSDLDPEDFVRVSREIWRRSDLCFVRPSLEKAELVGWRRTKYREVEDPRWFLEAESFELKSV